MGLRELCRCGRRPRRGGRCRLGENRNQGSRAIRHGALLGRQGAVIREGRDSATSCRTKPASNIRRHRDANIAVYLCLFRRAAGSVERSDRGAAMWRRVPLSDGRGSTPSALPNPPTAGTEMSYTPPCSVPQNRHSSPCKMPKNCPPQHLPSLSNHLIFNILWPMRWIG
jgi:hypothetical protein